MYAFLNTHYHKRNLLLKTLNNTSIYTQKTQMAQCNTVVTMNKNLVLFHWQKHKCKKYDLP